MHRTAGAYFVVAVMGLEGADLIMPSMGAPSWAYDLLVLFVVLLFPVAMVVSWVFDVTPQGLVRTGHGGSLGRHGPRSVGSERATGEPDVIDSLAILKFDTAGDDPDDDYLSEGIAESIINRMSGLSGLRVVPRSSAFRYRGDDGDLGMVGSALQVRGVVTGRVQHRGDKLLVRAELIDVVGPAQLWGEHYSRPMADVFDIQEEMATEIYLALSQTLSKEDERKLRHRETQEPAAYQAYLKGRYHWNRRSADGFREATRHFRDAIARDPRYARAYSGLADTYNVLGYYGIQAPGESYPPAKAAAQAALAIDPGLAEAHASMGYATLFYDRNWEAAARHFRDAIEDDATYASAHQWYGWYYLVMERFDECVACMEEAHRIDPLSLIINDHLAYSYLLAGRIDEVRSQIRKTSELSPDYPLAHWRLGDYRMAVGEPQRAVEAYQRAVDLTQGRLCLGYLGLAKGTSGDMEGASKVLARMDDDAGARYVSPLDRALASAGLADIDAVFEGLDQAVEERVSDVVRVKLLPWPPAVLADPRFQGIVDRLGLPAASRTSSSKPA